MHFLKKISLHFWNFKNAMYALIYQNSCLPFSKLAFTTAKQLLVSKLLCPYFLSYNVLVPGFIACCIST